MADCKKVNIVVINGQVVVRPPRVIIFHHNQEGVCWDCPQGSAKIQFSDSPFEDDVFYVPSGGGSVFSGLPLPGKLGEFKYSIIVTIRDDRRQYVIDPEVVVGE